MILLMKGPPRITSVGSSKRGRVRKYWAKKRSNIRTESLLKRFNTLQLREENRASINNSRTKCRKAEKQQLTSDSQNKTEQ